LSRITEEEEASAAGKAEMILIGKAGGVMDRLTEGGTLTINQTLVSNNGDYTLVMQADGNLVLYTGWPGTPSPIWASNTEWLAPAMRPTHAVMQNDGNFVLYNNTGVPAFATATDGHPGSYIVIQDDRNLVVYDPNNKPLWATGTNINLSTTAIPPVHQVDQVGWNKTMTSDVTLYSNGELIVDTFCQNSNPTGGLRGQVLVVAVDDQNRAICVSQPFQCATCCGVFDLSCASNRRQTFTEQWPDVVGQYTVRLDVHQADQPNFVDLRNQIVKDLCSVVNLSPALQQEIKQYFQCP
jgi:hypothetical protein